LAYPIGFALNTLLASDIKPRDLDASSS